MNPFDSQNPPLSNEPAASDSASPPVMPNAHEPVLAVAPTASAKKVARPKSAPVKKSTVSKPPQTPVASTKRPVKKKAPVSEPAPGHKKLKAAQVVEKAAPPSESRASVKKKSPINAKKAVGAKEKLVRDSFTMPSEDFALIAALKDRALIFKRPTKKSELLRAGLHALHALSAPALRMALEALTPLKAGRPKGPQN